MSASDGSGDDRRGTTVRVGRQSAGSGVGRCSRSRVARRWSTLPKAISTARRRASSPRMSLRISRMSLRSSAWPPEICTLKAMTAATMVPMIHCASRLGTWAGYHRPRNRSQERPAAARWARPRENPRGQQVRENAVNRGRRIPPAAAYSLRRYGGGVEARGPAGRAALSGANRRQVCSPRGTWLGPGRASREPGPGRRNSDPHPPVWLSTRSGCASRCRAPPATGAGTRRREFGTSESSWSRAPAKPRPVDSSHRHRARLLRRAGGGRCGRLVEPSVEPRAPVVGESERLPRAPVG